MGGATTRWGAVRAIAGEGSTVGVSSTSKNRPSHHKNKSPKHFELNGAEKLEEHIMPAGCYLFILFLRKNGQKRQTKCRSSEKIA